MAIHATLNFHPGGTCNIPLHCTGENIRHLARGQEIHDAEVAAIASAGVPAETRDSRGHVLFIRCPATPGVSTAAAKSVNACPMERNRNTLRAAINQLSRHRFMLVDSSRPSNRRDLRGSVCAHNRLRYSD